MSTARELATTTSADLTDARAELLSLPNAAALLDAQGCIVETNRTLQALVRRGDVSALICCELGTDFPPLCGSTLGALGAPAADGIRRVLDGSAPSHEFVYRWHSATRLRWFRLEARRPDAGGPCVILIHTDVTDLHMANARLNIQMSVSRALTSQMSMLAACRQLAIQICEELDWDYAGVWTIDQGSWTLRCVDTWLPTDIELREFERANRTAALAPGVGLAGKAWLTAKVQWATDLDETLAPISASLPVADGAQPRVTVMPPVSLAVGFRSALAFPLKCGDDVLAVVDFFSRVRRPPDPYLSDLLEVVGDQLALWELRERAEKCARAARQEADQAHSQLAGVFDCAPAYVLMLDTDGILRFINKILPSLRKETVIGAHWKTFVSPSGHAQVQHAFDAVLRTGAQQTYQVAVPHGDTELWFANYMGPMRSGEAITGVVIISQDITSTRMAQSELMGAQRLAAVGTLAAGIAHEINTPVQFIGDSVHFLRDAVGDVLTLVEEMRALRRCAEQEGGSDGLRAAVARVSEAEESADLDYLIEQMPQAFERSLDGLARVTNIVRSMKEFAHPAQKEMAAADLGRAITSTLTVARSEYKDVANLDLQLGELPLVVCHINEINQVVLNIVVNAAHAIADVVKGTERKGLITVRTRRDGADAVLTVSDTGGGIPAHVAPRIFEPFFTTKEVGRGTGQGLAMVWNVIKERHGGELSFETAAGAGTTFLIRLPISGVRRPQEAA